jgi:hypothetical protein
LLSGRQGLMVVVPTRAAVPPHLLPVVVVVVLEKTHMANGDLSK